MIAQIGRLVEAAGQPRRTLGRHALGEMAGAGLIALIAAIPGVLLHAVNPIALEVFSFVALVAILVTAALSDLGLIGALTSDRQTPASWSCVLGSSLAPFAWGFHLGLVVLTRIPYQAVWALLAFAVLSGSVVAAIVVLGTYGLVRGLTVAAVVARSPSDVSASCTRINARANPARLVVAGLSITVAAIVVATA